MIAAGFLGSQKYVTDAFKIDLNPRTNVLTKTDEYETSVPGVFTAGDMHRGQSLVVWAIRKEERRESRGSIPDGYTTCKIFNEVLTRESPIAIIRNIKGKGVLSGGETLDKVALLSCEKRNCSADSNVKLPNSLQ